MATYNKSLADVLNKKKWKKQIPKRCVQYKMKEYSSWEDLRSWSIDAEENKQWFYEMAGPAKKATSDCGSIISPKVLGDILISYQKYELEDLKHYRALKLTDEQLRALEQLRAGQTPAEDGDGPLLVETLHDSCFQEQSEEQAEYDIQSSKDKFMLDKKIDTPQVEIISLPHVTSTDDENALPEIERLSQQLLKSEESFMKCQAELENLRKQTVSLEEQNLHLQDKLKLEKKELHQNLKDVEQERDEALNEINKCKQAMKQGIEDEGHIRALISERNIMSEKLEELSSIAIFYKDLESKLEECDQIKKERDVLQMKLQDLSQLDEDLKLYKFCAHDSEVLKLNNDRLQEQLDKMSSAESALQEATKKNEELEIMLQKETYKNDSLSREIDKCKHEVNDEMMKVEKLTAESLKHKVHMENQMSELQYKLQEKELELEQMQQQLSEAHTQCLCEEKDLVIENFRTELEERNQCNIASLNAKQAEVDQLQETLHKLSDDYKKALIAYDKTKKEEFEELLEKLQICDEKTTQLNELLVKLQLEKEQLENTCILLKQKKEEVYFENSKLMEELKKRPGVDDLKFLHEENEKLRNRLKKVSDKSDYLEDELNKACACLEHERQNSETENVILVDHSEKSEAKDCLDSLQKKNEALQSELQNTLNSYNLLIAELNDRPTKEGMILLEREVDKLRLERQGAIVQLSKMQSLETEVSELASQLNDYMNKNKLLETKINELNLHLEDITNTKLKLETETNELHLNLEHAIRQRNEISESCEINYKNNKNEILKLQQEIIKLKGDLEICGKDSSVDNASTVAHLKNSIDKLSALNTDSLCCNLKDILDYICQKLCEIDTSLLKESISPKQNDDNEKLLQDFCALKEEKQKLEEDLRQLSDTLCYQIDEIQNNLAEERLKNEEALQIIQELKVNVKEETKKREAAENSLRSTQMELETLQAFLKDCEESIDNYEYQVNDLQNKLDAEKRDTMQLKNLLEVSEIQLKTIGSSVEHITQSREDTVLKLDGCREELKNCKDVLKSMTAHNNTLKEEKYELEDNIKMLHAVIEELKSVEEEKVNLERVIQNMEKEKKIAETGKHMLEERVHDLEKVNKTLIEKSEKLQNEKKSANQMQKQQINSLDKEMWALKNELEMIKKDSMPSLKIASEEKKSLEIINNKVKAQVSELEKNLVVKDETIDQLKFHLEKYLDEKSILKKELDELQVKYSDMKRKFRCLDSECKCLKEQRESLTTDLLEINNAVTEHRKEIQGLRNHLLEQAKRSDTMEKDLANALTSSVDLKMESSLVKILALEETEKYQLLENELKECQNSKTMLLHANDKLKDEICRLNNLVSVFESSDDEKIKNKLISVENMKIEAEQNLRRCEESNIELTNKLKDLENKFTTLQNKNAIDLEELYYMKDMREEMLQINKDLERQNKESVKLRINLENDFKICKQLNEDLTKKVKNLEDEVSKHRNKLENNGKFVELEEERVLRKKLDKNISVNDAKERNTFGQEDVRCKLELERLCLECDSKIQGLLELHKKEIQNVNKNCESNLLNLKSMFDREKATLSSEHERKIQQLLKLHEEEMCELRNEYESGGLDLSHHKRPDNRIYEERQETEEIKEYDQKQKTINYRLEELKDEMNKEEIRLQAELNHITNEHNEKLAELREKYNKLIKAEKDRFKYEKDKIKRGKGTLELSETEVYELFSSDRKKGSLVDIRQQAERELAESTASDTSLIDKLSEGDAKDVKKEGISDSKLRHILKKVFKHGFEVLSLSELTLLHQPISSATTALVLRSASRYKLCIPESLNVTPGSPQEEKWKIIALAAKMQDNLKQQEESANAKVRDMEKSITREQRRISELKEAIKKYKEENDMLNNHVNHQADSISDLKVQKEILEQRSDQELKLLQYKLHKEEKKVQELEAELAQEKEKVNYLEKLLEDSKKKSLELNTNKCFCKQSSLGVQEVAAERGPRIHSQHYQSPARHSTSFKESR